MDITNKKNLAYFFVLVIAVTTLLVTMVIPVLTEKKSQKGIDSINKVKQKVETYEE